MFDKNKGLIVCAFTDKGGTMGMSQSDEYIKMQQDIQCLIYPEIDISFEKDVAPDDLINKNYDIYIFDYGGAMTSYGDENIHIDNYYRPLMRRINGHPEKLFFIWSSYTEMWYRSLITKESPELIAPNVITMEWRDKEIERARTFFGLKPDINPDDYFKRLGIKPNLKVPRSL
jgi:hypothetical protein